MQRGFTVGSTKHRPASHPSQLYPFCVIDQGTFKVERHVPAIPLSKEVLQFGKLKNSLVLYRMVFGQNRQEDLANDLQQQASYVKLQKLAKACQIVSNRPNTTTNILFNDTACIETSSKSLPEFVSAGKEICDLSEA